MDIRQIKLSYIFTTGVVSGFFNWAVHNHMVWWITFGTALLSFLLVFRKFILHIGEDYIRFKKKRLFKPDQNKKDDGKNL